MLQVCNHGSNILMTKEFWLFTLKSSPGDFPAIFSTATQVLTFAVIIGRQSFDILIEINGHLCISNFAHY